MSTTAVVIHSNPDILGGTPVFVGIRVPLRNLIDYLERNYTLDEFLDSFPTVVPGTGGGSIGGRSRSGKRACAFSSMNSCHGNSPGTWLGTTFERSSKSRRLG